MCERYLPTEEGGPCVIPGASFSLLIRIRNLRSSSTADLPPLKCWPVNYAAQRLHH